jgi:HD superfamily phosphohydrolase
MEVRDPIHGPIPLSQAEEAVYESPWFQRLRGIEQLGFSSLTFPGATHTRLLHSLGAMHLCGQAFDAVFREVQWLLPNDRARLRQTARLAALCHDLGHPPLSHTSEVLVPSIGEIAVPGLPVADPSAHGSHEHMTLKLLLDSPLSDAIAKGCAGLGTTARHVAALLSDEFPSDDGFFQIGSKDLRSVLAGLTSSELDCDRMDYLLRDSYFTGVSYGKFDADWLISHLGLHETDGGVQHLCLDDRAVFSFDDFLLSRHHMFLMVYFHRKSVCYDEMLRRFYAERPADLLPVHPDPDAWLRLDDAAVWRALREFAGHSAWAKGIIERKPLQLVAESSAAGRPEPLKSLVARLTEAGIAHLHCTSRGALTKYLPGDLGRAIYVRRRPIVGEAEVLPLTRATRLYERYQDTTVLERVYVEREHSVAAGRWLLELREKP